MSPMSFRHREVLTDDGIGPAGGDGSHGVGQTRQLAAVDGGIQRHMNGHAPGMAEPDGFFQAVGIKIARTGAALKPENPRYTASAPLNTAARSISSLPTGARISIFDIALPLTSI
mgnify:CR=1 FL=1